MSLLSSCAASEVYYKVNDDAEIRSVLSKDGSKASQQFQQTKKWHTVEADGHEDLIYNLFFLNTFILPSVSIVYGCVYCPKITIPIVFLYYLIILIERVQTRDGSPWMYFAEEFPIFKKRRQHHNLRFLLPKSGSLGPNQMRRFLDSSPTAAYVFGFHPHGVTAQWRTWMEGLM